MGVMSSTVRAAPRPTDRDDALLSDGVGLRSVFQPLVRLADSALVGYEVLSRGPRGHRLESPLALMAEAARTGREIELDWAMLTRALRSTLAVHADPRLSWFFNAERRLAREPLPADLLPLLRQMVRGAAAVRHRVHRAVPHRRPGSLLAAVDRVRAVGGGVALDDVGADPASLALLPLVNPDVVKLDMRLVRQHLSRDIATITNAVRAHCEDTGAVTLAEGIETEDDVLVAEALGAQYGQGWLFGRPAEEPASVDTGRGTCPGSAATRCATRVRRSRSSPPEGHRRHPEAAAPPDQPLPRGPAVHDARVVDPRLLPGRGFYTPHIAGRYPASPARHLHRRDRRGPGCRALPGGPRDGARPRTTGSRLEWNVVVVGPHFAGALLARDLGTTVRTTCGGSSTSSPTTGRPSSLPHAPWSTG